MKLCILQCLKQCYKKKKVHNDLKQILCLLIHNPIVHQFTYVNLLNTWNTGNTGKPYCGSAQVSDCLTFRAICFVAAPSIGTKSKMKLWDVLATCLLLLSSVSARPLLNKLQPSKRALQSEGHRELLVLDPVINSRFETTSLNQASMEEQCKSAI